MLSTQWGSPLTHWGRRVTPVGEWATPVGSQTTPMGRAKHPIGVFSQPTGVVWPPSGVIFFQWGGALTPLERCPPHWETPLGCSPPQRGRGHPTGKLRVGWPHPSGKDEWGRHYPNGHGRARPSYCTDLLTEEKITAFSKKWEGRDNS